MSGKSNSLKSILYALVANGFIALIKFGAAIYTGSGAMLAEAIHSCADCGNQLLLILGMKRARRPATPDYPLGYGKTVYFWSFVVAIMLFSVGGLFSIYEGLHKLDSTEAIKAPWVAVVVLVVSIFIEAGSMYGCMVEVNKDRGKKNIIKWFRETRQSELLVVFGEDLAALLGLGFALVFILLAIVTGNPVYDAIGSIGIGVLLVVIALFITIQIKKFLIGRSASPETRKAIEEYVKNFEGVEEIFNLITIQQGEHIMVSVKARITPCGSADEMVRTINRCEAGLKEKFPEIQWLFFEPDLSDEECE
jgi:cation diffusion facilitator family transporter